MSSAEANLLATGLMAISAIGIAAILRWARCPGWAVVGGVVAGFVVGPSILGRVAPDLHEQLFMGGIEQRQVLHDLQRDLDIASTVEAGVDAVSQRAMSEEDRPAIQQAQRELDAARWDHQRVTRAAVIAATALMLIVAGPMGVPRGGRAIGLVGPMSIGAWSAGVPGAIAFALVPWWSGSTIEALLVAAAVAIGPWVLHRVDRESADQAEVGGSHTIESAGRVASLIAIAAIGAAIWLSRESSTIWLLAAMMALPLGWVLPSLGQRSTSMQTVIEHALVPIVGAAASMKIDLFEHVALWPILVLLLLSGDGRWLGALIGALLPGGRKTLRTMRLVLGSMAAGPTQLAVAALAIHCGLLSERLGLALVLGAVLIELVTPARRGMAGRLIELEEGIADSPN